MFGVVTQTDSQAAFLYAPGVSRPVLVPFTEIRNATPKVWDFAEVVSFTLVCKGDATHAKDVRILIGKSEREAREAMSFHAGVSLRRGNDTQRRSRDKDQVRPKPRAGTKRSGKGGHFVRDRFAVIEPDAP